MDRTKKLLITLLVIGALATIGAGTYATFNAQVSNQGNTFTTGTLVLSNTVGATTCYSTSNGLAAGGNTDTNTGSTNCAVVFNGNIVKPGDSQTFIVGIKNEGSVNSSALKVFMQSCAGTTSGTFNGTQDPCTVTASSPFRMFVATCGTDNTCATPSAVYGTTAFGNTGTLADFATNKNSLANAVSLGGLNSGVTNYFQVGIKFNDSGTAGGENAYMGRKVTFDLTWNAVQ